MLNSVYKYYRAAKRAENPDRTLDRNKRDRLIKAWADEVLALLSIELEISGKLEGSSGLYVGNHMGYLDIAILESVAPFMFLAKKEVSHWPIIGTAVKYLDMPTVDRSNQASRDRVSTIVRDKILEDKERICIFPAGTTSLREDKAWRHGALKIAEEAKVPVQAFAIDFTPKRPCAFIDQDYFLPHLINLARHSQIPDHPIKARLCFSEPFFVKDHIAETSKTQDWCRSQIQ